MSDFNRYSYQQVGQDEKESFNQSINQHLDEEIHPFDGIEEPPSINQSFRQSINRTINDTYHLCISLPPSLKRSLMMIGLVICLIIVFAIFGSTWHHSSVPHSSNQSINQSSYHSVQHLIKIPQNGFLYIPYIKPANQQSFDDDEEINQSIDQTKGLLDSRIYHSLMLENGLEVLIISDQSIDQSSASLSVGVGSWMDYEQPLDDSINQSINQPINRHRPIDPVKLPIDRPVYGLAHLVEHALFLGSSRSIDQSVDQSINQSINQSVNSFSNFLAAHSGYTNAFTGEDQSTYLFSINCNDQSNGQTIKQSNKQSNIDHNSCFYSALDQFSQLVSEPLFADQSISQESAIQAIDRLINQEKKVVSSEHSKNIQNDDWRQWQLFKYRSNNQHPFSHWGTGSIDPTIYQHLNQTINQSIDRSDVRLHMAALHKRFYVPSNMKLVVASDQTIDQLISQIVHTFGAIQGRPLIRESVDQSINRSVKQSTKHTKQSNIQPISQSSNQPPFPIVGSGEVRLIEPIDPSIHQLSIFFSVQPRVTDWMINPHLFINSLIDRFSDCLIDRSWIHAIKTGFLIDESISVMIIDWTFRLTGEGLVNWMTIVSLLEQYLQLIKQSINQPDQSNKKSNNQSNNPSKNEIHLYDRWAEWKRIQSINFDQSIKQPAIEVTQKLSGRLLNQPVHQLLHSPYQLQYDEDVINQAINQELKIDQAIIHLMSSSINPSIFDSIEPIYQTSYAVFNLHSINQSINDFNDKAFVKQKLSDQTINQSINQSIELFLPAPNRFMPQSIKHSIKRSIKLSKTRSIDHPQPVELSNYQSTAQSIQVFMHPDYSFRQPRSIVYINIMLPSTQSIDQSNSLSDLQSQDETCISQSIKQSVKLSVYAKLVEKLLSTELAAAALLGYDQTIKQSNNQLTIKLIGLSDKMLEFAMLVLNGLLDNQSVDPRINQSINQIFLSVRSLMVDELVNQFGSLAYEQSIMSLKQVINQSKLSINQSIQCLQSIELNDFRSIKSNDQSINQSIEQPTSQPVHEFIRRLWVRSSITLFTYGDVDKHLTTQIAEVLINKSNYPSDQSINQSKDEEIDQSNDHSDSSPTDLIHLPAGTYLAQRQILNPRDLNVAVIFHHPIYHSINQSRKQSDESAQLATLITYLQLEIVYQLIKQSVYDELRTRQQLGYIVAAFMSTHPPEPLSIKPLNHQSINSYRALNIVVQGTDHSAFEITQSIDKCLQEMAETLRQQSISQSSGQLTDQINQIKQSMIDRRRRSRLIDLQQVGDLEWEEILSGRLMFDRRQQEIDILQSKNPSMNQLFAPESLIDFFVHHLIDRSTRTRLIVNTVQDDQHERELYVEHAIYQSIDQSNNQSAEDRFTVIDMDHLNQFYESINQSIK